MTIPRELSFLRNHASLSQERQGQTKAARKKMDRTEQKTSDREVRDNRITNESENKALKDYGSGSEFSAEMANSNSFPDILPEKSVNLREAEGEDDHILARNSSPSSFPPESGDIQMSGSRVRIRQSLFGYEIQGKEQAIQKLKDSGNANPESKIDFER